MTVSAEGCRTPAQSAAALIALTRNNVRPSIGHPFGLMSNLRQVLDFANLQTDSCGKSDESALHRR